MEGPFFVSQFKSRIVIVICRWKQRAMIEIIRKNENDFKFTLKSESGSVLLNSVLFSNEDEIKQMVQSLTVIQERRNVFERKTNHNGEFLFNLKNLKGEIIGTSQSYGSEAGMENGIKNLKKRILQLSSLNQL